MWRLEVGDDGTMKFEMRRTGSNDTLAFIIIIFITEQ